VSGCVANHHRGLAARRVSPEDSGRGHGGNDDRRISVTRALERFHVRGGSMARQQNDRAPSVGLKKLDRRTSDFFNKRRRVMERVRQRGAPVRGALRSPQPAALDLPPCGCLLHWVSRDDDHLE
jgi:hypothetical protein